MRSSDVDISGLPLFYVNKIITTKMDDGNVMVICGITHGTGFMPLYATVRPADAILEGDVGPERLGCDTSH